MRQVLSPVVVAGLAATTSMAAGRRWGVGRTAGAAATVVVGTGLVEGIGSRRGVPFGRYAYTDRLRPRVRGVPAVVPLAWWAMAVPAREAAVAALGAQATRGRRIVVGAAALTAWDAFLDPQMVAEGFWTWTRQGRYRGIPASNYLGWFATSLAVMSALDVLFPPRRDADPVLVGAYAGMAVMETLGFAAFFRDRVVAAVGGAAMLPTAVLAVARLRGGGRRG